MVIFYGGRYEAAQIHENMAENPKAESPVGFAISAKVIVY
jgi:hypothetical protein